MEIDLKRLSPWADVSRMLLNAKNITINGYSGPAEIENIDGAVSITFSAPKKAKK
jgi:hypothetical protein